MKHNEVPNIKHKLSESNFENIFDVFLDENGQYYYNILKTINFPEELQDDLYAVYTTNYNDTWFSLAWKFYNNVKLWWIICAVNNIYNPFIKLIPGTEIKILNAATIRKLLYTIKSS